jgi:tRNA-specific 2-thiouridylase
VRALARDAGLLGVADKPDSVEICFVTSGDHTDVVRRRRPEAAGAGVIRERDGEILGEHDGIDRFTIGQRKGLGVAAGRRRFVLEILPESREVVVGDPEELLALGLEASRVNWLIDPPTEPIRCTAKVRYRHGGTPGVVVPQPDGAQVKFDRPVSAVTPGQAVAFYDGSRVLGGGWIERSISA